MTERNIYELRNNYGDMISKHNGKHAAVARGIELKRDGKEAGHYVCDCKGRLVWSA